MFAKKILILFLSSYSIYIVKCQEERGEDITKALTQKEVELFSMLLSPNDTRLQQETKSLLAQYFIAQAMMETNKNRAESISSQKTSTTLKPVKTSTLASTVATIPTSTVSPAHVLNQVDKILNNVGKGNVVGIVDESLGIRAPTPVRNLVTGILQLVFCNPFDRLLNRCRQQANSVSSSSSRLG